jgi:hypothetical protein
LGWQQDTRARRFVTKCLPENRSARGRPRTLWVQGLQELLSMGEPEPAAHPLIISRATQIRDVVRGVVSRKIPDVPAFRCVGCGGTRLLPNVNRCNSGGRPARAGCGESIYRVLDRPRPGRRAWTCGSGVSIARSRGTSPDQDRVVPPCGLRSRIAQPRTSDLRMDPRLG